MMKEGGCGRQGQMSQIENFGCGYFGNLQFGEGGNDLDGLEANGDDLADKAENIFAIVFAIWIVGDPLRLSVET